MRNGTILKYNAWVALLAEGVDRNVMPCGWDRVALRVALLAEGVDRNWQGRSMRTAYKVALLAEGVDRNTPPYALREHTDKSPSSRRAWIEIPTGGSRCGSPPVALLAEGVDRNLGEMDEEQLDKRRPPRGGRG